MRNEIAALNARTWAALACAMLVALSSDGFGGCASSTDVAGKARAAYTQAQRQFQQELADFLATRRPDLKDLILVSRDFQLAVIERRSLEFCYLLATHPERIVRDHGISGLANYDSTDEDAQALRRSNPDYVATIRRLEVLQEHNEGNPQWSALRAANQALGKDADYQKIYARFERRIEAAGKLLKGSR
jgi:hypothetical protein